MEHDSVNVRLQTGLLILFGLLSPSCIANVKLAEHCTEQHHPWRCAQVRWARRLCDGGRVFHLGRMCPAAKCLDHWPVPRRRADWHLHMQVFTFVSTAFYKPVPLVNVTLLFAYASRSSVHSWRNVICDVYS
jgi:hypothetical protein